MNRIFYVKHVHQYYQDPNNSEKKYFDTKPVGFFYSKQQAQELIKRYRKLPGFKDSPRGFYIDEYVIDCMYNSQITNLVQKESEPSKKQDILYSIRYRWENDDDDDEIELLAFFSTKQKAKKALRELLQLQDLRSIKDRLDVYIEDINWKEWSEGFITWEESIKAIPKD